MVSSLVIKDLPIASCYACNTNAVGTCVMCNKYYCSSHGTNTFVCSTCIGNHLEQQVRELFKQKIQQLGILTPREERMLFLRCGAYGSVYTPIQIAQMFCLDHARVQIIISRARRKLKKRLTYDSISFESHEI